MSGRRGASAGRGWITSDASYPLHPFLFAIVSVLALMVSSLNQATYAHVVPALVGAMGFALSVYLATAALRRRLDARTAVIATVWIAGSLFYLDLFGWMNQLLGGGYSMVRSLPVALAGLALCTLIVIRLPVTAARIANLMLNCIALVMVATPAWQAAAYEWRNGAGRAVYDPDRAAAEMPQPSVQEARSETGRPPDIYHFVFDRYASAAILDEHYGYDDSATVGFLEEHGFHVARDSHSNYHRTAHSLASTFYMDYLDLLSQAPDLAGGNWQAVHAMLGDHRVARFLKARDYEFIQFGSWWTGTFRNPIADTNRPHGFSEFNMLYLRRTMLRPIFHVLPDWPLTMRLDWDNAQCQRVAAQVEEIKGIGERARPVYVFAHILVPHGPFNFSAEGECLTTEESAARGARQGYLDQVAYAGRMIEDLVTHLQSSGRAAPVILIQSDEGPFPASQPGVPWQEQPAAALRIKTGILNAYSIPGASYDGFTDRTSPVNSYRLVFNALFGSGFRILPDRVFVSPNDNELYEFHDITDKVR